MESWLRSAWASCWPQAGAAQAAMAAPAPMPMQMQCRNTPASSPDPNRLKRHKPKKVPWTTRAPLPGNFGPVNPVVHLFPEAGMARDVAVLVGSLRKDSLNRKLAHAMIEMAPTSLKLEEIPIIDLPLYNPDLDDVPLAPWAALRQRIKRSDAVLFVTPEHNRSVPAALKNAIDIASRPYGASAWNGKPAAVVSASPGAIGGLGANHHLRQSLVFLNMPAMPQPEAYIG